MGFFYLKMRLCVGGPGLLLELRVQVYLCLKLTSILGAEEEDWLTLASATNSELFLVSDCLKVLRAQLSGGVCVCFHPRAQHPSCHVAISRGTETINSSEMLW